MKPGPQKWATNATYAAGVDAGNQNKYEPSSGRVDDGLERAKKLATGWENMVRWRLAERIDAAAQFRLKNWSAKPSRTLFPWGAGCQMTVAGVYRPIAANLTNDLHQILPWDSNAATGDKYDSVGGDYWYSTAVPHAAIFSAGLASDDSGNAGACLIGVASGLYFSIPATFDTYSAWAGTVGEAYYAIDYDAVNGYWIGAESTVPKIASGTAVGVALTQRNTNAIIANTFGCLKRSNHGPGKLYPQDPGNDAGLFIPGGGGANLLRSTDALSATWSTVAAAPFMPAPATRGCLGYSAWGSRWGVLTIVGPTTGANKITFAYSDDNGDNWVELNDPFGFTSRGLNNYSQANDNAQLLCDGFGHWVAVFKAGTGLPDRVEAWASADNGLTWYRVYVPFDDTTTSGTVLEFAAWYGDGAFWLCHVGRDGAGTPLNEIASSLRAPE